MSRPLELADLDTDETGIYSRPCIRRTRPCYVSSNTRLSRCFNDYTCYPCIPRCRSSSPRRYVRKMCPIPERKCRRRVSKRGLKSGLVTCDQFSTVCYPRKIGDTCRTMTPPRRTSFSCSPDCSCRPCTPIRGDAGVCRVSCRRPRPFLSRKCSPCPSLSPCSPCTPRSACSPCPPRSPCSPCPPCSPGVCDPVTIRPDPCLTCPPEDLCDPEPSSKFTQAIKSCPPCNSRYQSHLCPWEADVTVNGVVRAHCTSTADEITGRLAGPFKAFGKRFTDDSEISWACRDSCRPQKLNLGTIDDGGLLDFSRNNRPSDHHSLDYRIKRIMNSPTGQERRGGSKSRSSRERNRRDSHISWDRKLEYDDYDSSDGNYNERRRHRNGTNSSDNRRESGGRSYARDQSFDIVTSRNRNNYASKNIDASYKEKRHHGYGSANNDYGRDHIRLKGCLRHNRISNSRYDEYDDDFDYSGYRSNRQSRPMARHYESDRSIGNRLRGHRKYKEERYDNDGYGSDRDAIHGVRYGSAGRNRGLNDQDEESMRIRFWPKDE